MKTELLAWLINATVATSLASLAVLLLRKPLQRWLGAEIAYRLWIVLPLAALAACFSLPQAAPVATSDMPALVASTPAVVVRLASDLRSVDAERWLLNVWLLGAGVLLALLMFQQRRFVSRLRLHQSGDGSWRSRMTDAAPAVLGVLRQKLVLPEGFETSYTDDEQQLVLAHERMHQQRRDPWALAVCASLRMLFWFNPIVHFAAGRFRRDVEMACDAAVLRTHPGSRQRYASALLKTHIADNAVPVGCLWHYTPPMKERIMLLKQKLPSRYTRLAGAILIGIASLAITGLAVAGHDSAMSTASALGTAGTLAPTVSAPPAAPDVADAPAPPAAPDVSDAPAPPAAPDVPAPPAPPSLTGATAPPAPPAPPPPPPPVHAHARAALAPLPPLPPIARTVPPAPLAPMAPLATTHRNLAAGRAPLAPVAPLAPAAPVPPTAPRPPSAPAAPTDPVFGPRQPVPPAYPAAAAAGKIRGEVKLKVLIGADGSVQHATVVSSRPAGVFDQASLDAAKKWHFVPGHDAAGHAVAAYAMVPVLFKR